MFRFLRSTYILYFLLLFSLPVFSAGYEKTVLWGAKEQGRAGAAVSVSSGPDALFFNPAGLVNQDSIQALTFNFSPLFSEFKHPVFSANSQETSEQGFSPVFGINYNYKLRDDLALSMGGYVSGGIDLEYKDLETAISGFKASPKAKLSITELAFGVGYELSEGLSLGLAWRVSFVGLDFASATSTTIGPGVGVATQTELQEMNAVEFSGIKFGAMYAPDESWGVGFVYRSSVEFEAEGNTKFSFANNTGVAVNGLPNTAGATANLPNEDIKLVSELPQQIVIGGHYIVMPDLTVMAEYSWTEYSKVDKIDLKNFSLASEIVTEWKDQSVFRLGAEWTSMGFPLRVGYAYTSIVTPEDAATETFPSPGDGHDITFGAGYELMDGLALDVAFDYAFSSAEIDDAGSVNGKYESSAYQIHFGATYGF